MNIQVNIIDGPLQRAVPDSPPRCGAIAVFAGIVREMEDGRPLKALHYDTYEPMAQNMLAAIARDLMEHYRLTQVHVMHSRGEVGVGECSFQMMVASAHRKEALAAMDAFIDRMKQDVPIWKRPIWREDASTV